MIPTPRAGVIDGWQNELALKDRLWIEMNMLAPVDAPPRGGSSSLEFILSAPNAKVLDQLQAIDGHVCHVVDGAEGIRLYLDVDRGILPLRFEYRPKGVASIYGWSDKAVEVEKGLFLNVHGFRHIVAGPGMGLSSDIEMEISVDGWQEGKPALKVNSGVADPFFTLWNRVPKGTEVIDQREQSLHITERDPEIPIEPPIGVSTSAPASGQRQP
jgi:hypothetical protein